MSHEESHEDEPPGGVYKEAAPPGLESPGEARSITRARKTP